MGLGSACCRVQWQLNDVNLSSYCPFSSLSQPGMYNNQQPLCQHSLSAAVAKWEPYLNCWSGSQNSRATWGQLFSWPDDLLQHQKSLLTPAEGACTPSFHRFSDKMFCSPQEGAQLVEKQTRSLSGLLKTTLVWLTLWFSKSDSRHHSGKLVLTKWLRWAGMGHPNLGLVSQQAKWQPSFPRLRLPLPNHNTL